jgi:catechol 2,3-dioxygenase-like lactoylglutathione lyase family enzyme
LSIHRLTHLGICVSELPRAIAFYRDALGFREVGRYSAGDEATERILEVEGAQLELVYLERDGVRIELLYYPSPGCVGSGERRPMNALGFTHLSFAVDDLEQATRAIEEHGGRVLGETRARFKSGNRGLFALDPDGARIELIERRGDPNAVPGTPEDGG